MSEVSNHPVHMFNTNGSMMPSSFIPYCSLGSRLGLVGAYMTNSTFPFCNMFQLTAYEGQLCYRLDISKDLSKQRDFYQGKDSGLMLVIDTNKEKFLNILNGKKKTQLGDHDDLMIMSGVQKDFQTLPRVQIGTLAAYTGYGPGDYMMSSLKEITGTDRFLAKPDDEKDCTIEKFENCQMRKAAEQNRACSCKPFELSSAFSDNQVISYYLKEPLNFLSSPGRVHPLRPIMPSRLPNLLLLRCL